MKSTHRVHLPFAFGLIFLVISSPAFANPGKTLFVGVGSIAHQAMKGAGGEDGRPSTFGTFYHEVGLILDPSIGGQWTLPFSFFYSPFGNVAADAAARNTLMIARLGLNRHWGAFFAGPGTGIYLFDVTGLGGSSVQNNGVTTTSFGLPGASSTSKTFFLDLAFGILINSWRVDFDLLMNTPFSNSRRAWGGIFQVSYAFR